MDDGIQGAELYEWGAWGEEKKEMTLYISPFGSSFVIIIHSEFL